MCYIDMALLCNYSYMGYKFLDDFGVGGGEAESYVNTRVYYTSSDGTRIYYQEDYSWRNYSYAKRNFFEFALDINAALPVFGRKNQNIALGVSLLLWRRYQWMYKYYGLNSTSSSDISFEVENIRKNYDKETWLNSSISFIYRYKTYNFRFDISQPLIYNLTPRTRITDKNGKNVISELKKESMWVSQSGLKLGLFVATSLKNIFRRSFSED